MTGTENIILKATQDDLSEIRGSVRAILDSVNDYDEKLINTGLVPSFEDLSKLYVWIIETCQEALL